MEEACPQCRADSKREREQAEDERKRGERALSPCSGQGQSGHLTHMASDIFILTHPGRD